MAHVNDPTARSPAQPDGTVAPTGPGAGQPGTVEERLDRLRQFFRLGSAREWAQATGRDEADAEAYRSAFLAAQAEARALAGELAAAGRADLVAQLVNRAGLDLLLPVCAALQEAAFEPAVAPLCRLYRATALEGQLAILRVVAATGGAAGYPIAQEALEAREPALREAAQQAVAAIEARHPALRALGHLLRGEPVRIAPEEVGPLVAAMLESASLDRAIPALRLLCQRQPELQDELRSALWAAGARSVPGARGGAGAGPEAEVEPDSEAGVDDGSTVGAEAGGYRAGAEARALLLLGSQDWPLYPRQERAVLQAFHRAALRERRAFLALAAPARAQAALQYGLSSGARRNLGQTVQHLKEDRPDLVPLLAEPLLQALDGAGARHRAEILALLGSRLSSRALEAYGLPRRLFAALQAPEYTPWRLDLLRALVSSAPGRQLLTTERLDASFYPLLSRLVEEGGPEVDVSAVCLAVAGGLQQEQALDAPRLSWVLQQVHRVSQEARPGLGATLGRAVAAQLLFGSEPQAEQLLQQLAGSPELGAVVLPHLLPVVLGLPPKRLARVVELIGTQVPHPLAPLAKGLEAARKGAWLLLDGVLALETRAPGTAEAFIAQSPDRAFYRQMIADAFHQLVDATAEAARRWEEEEAASRSRLEAAAGPMLEEVARRILDLPESGQEVKEQLALYLQDFEDAIYAAVDAPPVPLPLAPVETGNPLADYQQALVVHQTVAQRLRDRALHFAAALGKRIALPLEKICLAAGRQPEPGRLLEPILTWLEEQGLRPVEPQLGRRVELDRRRHQPLRESAVGRYVVAALGLMTADGAVIHPALVTPWEEGDDEQHPGR